VKIFEFCDRWCPLRAAWHRRTTIMGYLTVMWGVLELNPDQVGDWVSKPRRGIVILVAGMVNAAIGHYNNALIKRMTAQRAWHLAMWRAEYLRLTGKEWIEPTYRSEEE
jgi:hypothetical protein